MGRPAAAAKCKGCDRTEERTALGVRTIRVNKRGLCRACVEAAGEMTDERNPAYLFQGTSTALLVQIARGDLNALQLAKQELAARGLDIRTGKWVGFEQAKETAKLHATAGPRGRRVWVTVPDSDHE